MAEPSPEAVEALFHEAVDLPAGERDGLLRERCGCDAALRTAVEELLACDAQVMDHADFLQSPVSQARDDLPATIGRYRIVRCLGSGGMGKVFEAEQDNPRRTVALKVMRVGFDSVDLRKRFVREASILGRLHHTGIAQVHDAGSTEDGQLYFAMEYVRGLTLDEHARRRAPDLNARLELVARVCDAVQHAHGHGVVHRDLKPGNVLVDDAGQPKVVDFGIAHAAAGSTESAAHTRTGELIGTLGYMSPEQVSAEPNAIDARSDVYSLGVILYELLADRLPYQLDHLPLPAVMGMIREVEPSRLGAVNRACRGEVETIVAKAMEKDKARRYQSAGELASDIRRHLAREPILARPASALYLARKFASRHKGLVAGTAIAFAALAGATVFSLIAARDARTSAKIARSQAYQARLAAAVAALSGHDVADARVHLNHAPEELRGWEWRHLHSRLDERSATFAPAPGETLFPVAGVAGIRVGRFNSGGVALEDLAGRPVGSVRFESPFAEVETALQLNAGLRVVDTFGDNKVRLWDGAGRIRHLLEQRTGTAALSPVGKQLALVMPDQEAVQGFALYDFDTGLRTAVCRGHTNQIFALRFSPDGKRVASAGEDGVAQIWDAATGAKVARCQGHTSKVVSLAFRADGKRLLTGSSDGTVRQWDATTGKSVETQFGPHAGEVRAVEYSPDGEWVASGGTDRTIRVWRSSGLQEVAAVLHGHAGLVSDLAFTPDGRRLVSASRQLRHGWGGDDTVGVWEVDVRAGLPSLRGHSRAVYPVAYSPDGQWIASGSWDRTVRLWDAATGEAAATLPQSGVVRALAFSPDGSWLVCGGDFEDGLVLWDVATGRVRSRIPAAGRSVRSIAASADGTRIASGNYDEPEGFTTSLWDAATGRLIAKAPGLPFAFSPDGKWLAGRDADEKKIVLRDARDSRVVATWSGHDAQVNSLAFRRDGSQLLSASSDRTVRVWDVATGRCLRDFRGHTDEVFTAAFHPDGTRVASAGRDRAVMVWDPASDGDGVRLQGHMSFVWSLEFSPDGHSLATGSGDGTIRLWDTAPVKTRYQARREIEAAGPEAARLVQRLLAESGDPSIVGARLRTEVPNDAIRRANMRELLRLASEMP